MVQLQFFIPLLIIIHLLFPINIYADSGRSTVVMDIDSGRIVYSKNMYEKNSEIVEDNVIITHANIKQYSKIIFSNKYQNIIFPYINIRLLRNSFMKICSLAGLYPEEVTRFTFYKEKTMSFLSKLSLIIDYWIWIITFF